MENSRLFSIAMFADLVDKFSKRKDIPTIVVGSRDASADDYREILEKETVETSRIEFHIDRHEGHAASVRDVWEILLPRFQCVVQCASDIPYYTPSQYLSLLQLLSRVDFVFHPTMDGGMCPYGSKKPVDIWSGIESQKSDALTKILNRLRNQKIRWRCANMLFDIDTANDLRILYQWMQCLHKNDPSYCPRTVKLYETIFPPE
ncbi:MAG: hypothetical protein AAB652_02720 [Patescibacteria group bacterium]